jgi:hypothetical protein
MVIVAGSHPNKNVRGWSAAQGEKKRNVIKLIYPLTGYCQSVFNDGK